jgi:hypothetical protein
MKFFGIFIIVFLLIFGALHWIFNGFSYVNEKPIIINNTDTIFVMNVTCYKITNSKCWNNKSAFCKTIDRQDPFSSKTIALPREMIKKYNKNAYFSFGDSVLLTGKDFIYQGKYMVGETTATSIHNSIDICVGKKNKIGLWKGIFIKKNK